MSTVFVGIFTIQTSAIMFITIIVRQINCENIDIEYYIGGMQIFSSGKNEMSLNTQYQCWNEEKYIVCRTQKLDCMCSCNLIPPDGNNKKLFICFSWHVHLLLNKLFYQTEIQILDYVVFGHY